MAVALADFRQRIVDSGMMSCEELDQFIAELQRRDVLLDTYELARHLVHKEKLTEYQARAICLGKGRALNLGNYVILRKVGEGGMGIVFQARHRRMHRIVAIKVLSSSGRKMPSSVRRFRREVQAAGRLEHPNIVAAYDADEADGVEFLVMQYVDGTSLSRLVKDRGPLPVPMAISCILQAARGLEYAHHRGVVHRDVKPSNLLLDRDGTLKILDMGLARLDSRPYGGADPELTDTGEVMGTADYMAPEQAANMKLSDGRADIYSLGYTLWYLLTGREAYPASNRIEKIVAHFEKPIPSLQEARPEVSAALDAVFKRMVAKKPEDRYQVMAEVITDLERCRTSESAAETHAPPPSDDRELTNFLQNLPELALDREPTHGRRSSSVGSFFKRKDGRGRKDSARNDASTVGTQRLGSSHDTRPTGTSRRSDGPRRIGLLLVAIVALAALLVAFGIPPSQRPEGPPHGNEKAPEPPPISTTLPAVNADWVNLVPDDKLGGWTEVGEAKWKVEGGVLVGQGSGGWLATRKSDYRDFELLAEYKISPGAQSGIILRPSDVGKDARFLEVQIQDDAAPKYKKAPKTQRTAAVTGVSPPSLQVASPAETWHTIVVRMKAREVKVWLDGWDANHVNLNDVGLQHAWILTRPFGCIGLEAGGGTVEFRRLLVHDLSADDKQKPDAQASAVRNKQKSQP